MINSIYYFGNIKKITKNFKIDSIYIPKSFLIIVGFRCSGKTTFINFIKEKSNYVDLIEYSYILRKIAEVNNWTKDLKDLLNYLRRNYGKSVILKLILQKHKHKKLVISGINSFTEYNYLNNKFNSVKILLIKAPLILRWKRNLFRRRISELNFLSFLEYDFETYKNGLIKLAENHYDYYIYNNHSLKEYRKKCLKVFYSWFY